METKKRKPMQVSMDEESFEDYVARACLEHHETFKAKDGKTYEKCEHGAYSKYGNEAFLMKARWQDFIQDHFPGLKWEYKEEDKRGQADLFFSIMKRNDTLFTLLQNALPDLGIEDYPKIVLPIIEEKMREAVHEIITSKVLMEKGKGTINGE